MNRLGTDFRIREQASTLKYWFQTPPSAASLRIDPDCPQKQDVSYPLTWH